MTSEKFLKTQELECLLAVDTICGHLKYWGVFCIRILATVQHCSISVLYQCIGMVLYCVSVLATGSKLYVSVYWPHSKCPKSELWQLGKQQARTNRLSFLFQETVFANIPKKTSHRRFQDQISPKMAEKKTIYIGKLNVDN